MARQASGAITITDVADGTSPIAAFLSNNNHTFPALNDGSVTNTDLANFSTSIRVYIGVTEATFNSTATTDAAMASNTYRLALNSNNNTGSLQGVGSGWTALAWIEGSAGSPLHATVTGPSVSLNNTTADAATLTINIRVKNTLGTISLIPLEVSFSKAPGGSQGDTIQLDMGKMFFTADSSGTYDPVAQDDIVVNIYTSGAPGAQRYYTSQDGAGFVEKTTVANTIGNIKGFDLNRSGVFSTTGTIATNAQRLTLSTNNLGTNGTLTLKVTGSTDNKGNESESIAKLTAGTTGVAALSVEIETATTTFSGGDQGAKTLTARVYDNGTGNEITSGLTYSWKLGESSGAAVKIDNVNDRNVSPSGTIDASTQTIVVDSTDVVNSQQYTCVIVVV